MHVWNENSQSDEIRLNFRNVGKAPTLTRVGVRIIIHQFLHPLMGHMITTYLILETDVMYMRNYILLSKDQVLDEVAKGKAHTTSSHSFISTLALGPNPKAPVPWRIIHHPARTTFTKTHPQTDNPHFHAHPSHTTHTIFQYQSSRSFSLPPYPLRLVPVLEPLQAQP